jgi:hypothetical protein
MQTKKYNTIATNESNISINIYINEKNKINIKNKNKKIYHIKLWIYYQKPILRTIEIIC